MRRHGVVALVVLASMGVLAPTAGATIRVTSTATDGLVITDLSGTFSDAVVIRFVSTDQGLRWEVSKTTSCGTLCLDLARYEPGAGCTEVSGQVVCQRLRAKVTLNLAGGDDAMSVATASLPITDPIVVNGGAGNDTASGALGGDTLNGGPGSDSLAGKAGNDALVGEAGDDRLFGEDGSDTLQGGDGNDLMSLFTGADVAEGGAGADRFDLATRERDERDQVNGGTGGDSVTYTSLFGDASRRTAMRIIEANLETLAGQKDTTENDVLRSIESYEGGLDEDIITGAVSSNASNYLGGGDDDTLFGSSAANTLTGGAGTDFLDGNGGDDVLDGKAGEGSTADGDLLIDCGAGFNDLAVIDLKDDQRPKGCETIERAPANETPHARPRTGRVTRVARGRVRIRVTCPRTQRGRCSGRVALRIGRASSKRARFSIRRGGSKRVAVRLGRLGRRVGRRTVAQLVSSERGKIGPKTITRRVVLRGPGR